MKHTHLLFAVAVIAVLAIGGGYPTCKCPNAGEDMKWQLDQLLRVRRWEVVTNVTEHFVIGRIDNPVWMTNCTTNAIIGTTRMDMFKAEAMR